MDLREAFVVAVEALRVNRMRSILTALGIIIGVAAVIMLAALGEGVQAGFDAQFGRLANQITVSSASGSATGVEEGRDLTDSDVAALRSRERAPDVASVIPSMLGWGILTAGQVEARTTVIGSTADYLYVTERTVAVGKNFSQAQEQSNARVAILGAATAANISGGNGEQPVVGSSVRIGRSSFKVIGVLAPDDQQDNIVIVPLGASRAYLLGGRDVVNQITIKSSSAASVRAAVAQVTAILDDRHNIKDAKERDFNVRANGQLLNKRTEFISFLTVFTVSVAAISLLVGGIGLANIMLVSVTERTREIGLRKAIGAPRDAILKQFLIESIVLSGLGGIAGVILGVGIALVAGTALTNLTPEFPEPIVSIVPVLLAFGVSLVIGVVAGGYPANRAARLHPTEALRFE